MIDDYESKNRSEDRTFVLRAMPGQKKLGLTDPELLTGNNKLHAIRDQQTMLWSLKFERGNIPVSLRQKWTKFSEVLAHVRMYYQEKNIEVIEVID